MQAHETPSWVLLAYLVSGICFILALRGLSSPVSSRRGNTAGMIGMAIAVATTLAIHEIASLPEIVAAMAVGGGIGLFTARKIQMTAMPQLVAAFHSLVGMAAVLVGAAAYLNPEAFGIATGAVARNLTNSGGSLARLLESGPAAVINPVSRVEMGLGIAIGAITFSGSVIAFLKLNGNMSGKPILLPARHVINLGTLAAILGLIAFVPLAGFVVFPLTAAGWLLRGFVFQYLALTALGAYLTQYRHYLRGAPPIAAVPGQRPA